VKSPPARWAAQTTNTSARLYLIQCTRHSASADCHQQPQNCASSETFSLVDLPDPSKAPINPWAPLLQYLYWPHSQGQYSLDTNVRSKRSGKGTEVRLLHTLKVQDECRQLLCRLGPLWSEANGGCRGTNQSIPEHTKISLSLLEHGCSAETRHPHELLCLTLKRGSL